MNETHITVQGYVGGEVDLRQAGDTEVAVFRIGCTPRRLNRRTGEWSDGHTQWFTVNAWRTLGRNVARSLRKGDAVAVSGRLNAYTYVNKQNVEVTGFEIDATFVGHDLNRGSTVLARNERLAAGERDAVATEADVAEAPPMPPADGLVEPSDDNPLPDWQVPPLEVPSSAA